MNFVNEDFNFKDGILHGTKQIKPRWKRVVISTDGAIGEALGKLYVADYFPPEAKARALELVNNLKQALSAIGSKLLNGWTSQPSKKRSKNSLP
jgi:putative endopeptidase